MHTNDIQVHETSNTIDLNSFIKSIPHLRDNSVSFRQQYNSGQPYSHLLIDNLFDEQVLDRVVAEFPKSGDRDWISWDTSNELKATSRGIAGLSPFTQLFCLWLNSSEFIDEIKKITGINDLVADPSFFGAGLHDMYRGGWLDVHADYTKHPRLPLIRRVNLLLYLNRDWDAAWGGGIELWDPKNLANKINYAPYFNRTLIFPTTSETFHGVPDRLSCPPERSRQLISIYYWSPAPAFIQAGTPIVWASDRSLTTKIRTMCRKLATKISGDIGNGFGL